MINVNCLLSISLISSLILATPVMDFAITQQKNKLTSLKWQFSSLSNYQQIYKRLTIHWDNSYLPEYLNLKIAKKISSMNNQPSQENLNILAVLQTFASWDIYKWKGLPVLSLDDLREVLGVPIESSDDELGWYQVQRLRFKIESPSQSIDVYVRDGKVLMLQGRTTPPVSILSKLGQPCAIKPHEILLEGAYVHEYLYCKQGLLISVAEFADKKRPLQLIRFRGIRSLEHPDELGAELYRAFEDQVSW